MDKRAYLIAVDILNPNLNYVKIKEYIKAFPLFDGWWSHLPGIFLVTTEASAEEIADVLRPETGDTHLLVIETNLGESEGWLPSRAWDWIRRRTPSEAKAEIETNA